MAYGESRLKMLSKTLDVSPSSPRKAAPLTCWSLRLRKAATRCSEAGPAQAASYGGRPLIRSRAGNKDLVSKFLRPKASRSEALLPRGRPRRRSYLHPSRAGHLGV